MKKALSALLVLAMVIACFAFTTSAAYSGSTDGIEKWWDRKTNPIEIKNAEELVFIFDYMAENVEMFAGKTLKLMNDVVINEGDFQDWGTNPPKYNWATRGQVEFQGTFDGNNHSISGLYSSTFYNAEKCIPFEDKAMLTTCYAGLFSKLSSNATVKNLRLTNSYVEGPRGTSMIAGYAGGNVTFENIQIDTFKLYGTYAQTSDPTVKDEVDKAGPYEKHSDTGALIGLGNGSSVTAKNCVVQGTVVGGGRFVGGYFGNLNKMHVEMIGCGFIGTLQSAYNQFYQGVNLFKENSGGLLGRTADPNTETGSVFKDCFFAGAFNANDKSTTSGTIVGRCGLFTAENCTVSEDVAFKFYDASKTTNTKGGDTGMTHMATKDMVGKDCVVLLGLDDTIWTAVEGIGPMLKAHEDAAATITTAAKTTISMVDTPTKTTAKKTTAAATTQAGATNTQAQASKTTATPTKKPSANTGDITVYMIAAVVVSAAAAVVVSKSRH